MPESSCFQLCRPDLGAPAHVTRVRAAMQLVEMKEQAVLAHRERDKQQQELARGHWQPRLAVP